MDAGRIDQLVARSVGRAHIGNVAGKGVGFLHLIGQPHSAMIGKAIRMTIPQDIGGDEGHTPLEESRRSSRPARRS